MRNRDATVDWEIGRVSAGYIVVFPIDPDLGEQLSEIADVELLYLIMFLGFLSPALFVFSRPTHCLRHVSPQMVW